MNSSLPARGVWIEIKLAALEDEPKPSLPARGVWIEIRASCWTLPGGGVTPRKGSVD